MKINSIYIIQILFINIQKKKNPHINLLYKLKADLSKIPKFSCYKISPPHKSRIMPKTYIFAFFISDLCLVKTITY